MYIFSQVHSNAKDMGGVNNYLISNFGLHEEGELSFYALEKQYGQNVLITLSCHQDHPFIVKLHKEYLSNFKEDFTTEEMYDISSAGSCLSMIAEMKKYPEKLNKAEFLIGRFSSPIFNFKSSDLFNQFDLQTIGNLNFKYHLKNLIFEGTRTLHHGGKAKKVIVFIHGLLLGPIFWDGEMVKKLYLDGYNIILAHMPGPNIGSYNEQVITIQDWQNFIQDLGVIAKKYGEKVTIVGHSIGGQFAVRMSEMGFADQLILLNPFMGESIFAKSLIQVGKYYSSMTEILSQNCKYNKKGCLSAVVVASELAKMPYRRLNLKGPNYLLLTPKDFVSYQVKTGNWLSKYGGHDWITKSLHTPAIPDPLGVVMHNAFSYESEILNILLPSREN